MLTLNKKLEKKQVICMLVNLICIKMIMTYPRIMAEKIANASWLNIIYVALAALLLFFIITKLYKSEYGNPVEAAEKIGGKWFKRLTGVIFSIMLILNMSYITRAYPEMVKTVLLIETNMSVIVIMYILAIAAGAYFSIESIARIHAIFIPLSAFVLIGFFLLSLPYCRINNLMPILGNGPYSIFGSGLFFVSIFSDLIVLSFLMSDMKTKRDIKNSGYTSIIISAVVSLFIMGTYNLIYPYPISTEFLFPVYQISRLVRVGNFFQRLEAFFQLVWSIGMYLYASLYICIISKIIVQSFDLKFHRPLIFPIAIIVWLISFLVGITSNLSYQVPISTAIMITVFCVPILFGIILKIKGTLNKSEGSR